MSFMEEVMVQNTPIWDACADTPFVRELSSGVLSMDKFKNYIIQDSIYLKHYARVYGKAMYHSTVLKDIQAYYSVLSFVTDTESAVRLAYLAQFGMTDDDIELVEPLPENKNYINFMLEVAEKGVISEILMAVLPCMLSYSYIFRKIAAVPGADSSSYWDFIRDYADDRYVRSCIEWRDFAENKCSQLSPAEQRNLQEIFKQASLLELDFWHMAYGESDETLG